MAGASEGGIAAAFVTGDQGAIGEEDNEAIRRSGLAHLLSVSGLHVSAVVAGVMLLTLRLLALSPGLALRAPLFAERLTRWPAASAEKVAAQALREGDFVRIGVGATVPADGVLVEGDGELDEALLTGEARPQLRRPGDCLTGGSYNLGNPLVMRVTGVGAATRLAVILRLTVSTPIQNAVGESASGASRAVTSAWPNAKPTAPIPLKKRSR